jgi:hypothetical protein
MPWCSRTTTRASSTSWSTRPSARSPVFEDLAYGLDSRRSAYTAECLAALDLAVPRPNRLTSGRSRLTGLKWPITER